MPGNPNPNRLVSQQNSASGIPWAEYIGQSADTYNASWGQDGSSVTLVFDMPWDVYTSFGDISGIYAGSIASLLGFAQYVPSGIVLSTQGNSGPAAGRISRSPFANGPGGGGLMPMQLPDAPWLWATRVPEVKGIGWKGKNINRGAGGILGSSSQYQNARLTVMFTTPNYNIVTDDALTGSYFAVNGQTPQLKYGAEILRYVTIEYGFSTEYLHIDKGSQAFLWADGPNGPVPGPAQATGQNINKLLGKDTFKLTWHQVPEKALFNPVTGLADNIRKCVGKVNSLPWPNPCNVADNFPNAPAPGFRPGVVLCEAPTFKPIVQPVPPGNLVFNGFNQATGVFIPPRCWEVSLTCKIFQPPQPTSGSYFPPKGNGWQTVPYFDPGSKTWLWFLTTASGDPAGGRIFEEVDFNQFLFVAL